MAYFFGRKLSDIESIPRASLVENIRQFKEQGLDVMVSIENVLANNFVYRRNNQATKAAQAKVSISIGRCQQAQAELMRDLELMDYRTCSTSPHAITGLKTKSVSSA